MSKFGIDSNFVFDKDGNSISTKLVDIDDSLSSHSLQFEQHNTKFTNRETKNKLYKKQVFKQLPLRFPDYDSLVTQEGATYLYPQGYTIDWEGNEIFIVYVPSGGSSTKRWIVIYDLTTQAYKSCLSAGNAGGEGIVIKREGEVRYLYVKSSGSSLGKYNISILPTNKAVLSSVATYDVGLFYDFSYRNGLWLIEQQGAPIGIHVRRTNFAYFDDNFNRVSSINISPTHGGFWVGDYVNYIPKRQGMALGDGFMVQGTGGYYGKGDTPIPYNYHGIKLLNPDGSLREEGLLDPSKTIEILEANGYPCDRLEGEGVHVSPEGEIYSLVVYQGRFMTESTNTGLLIFKEQAADNAIDFSSAGKVYQGFDTNYLSTGVFPRSGDGKMYDPFKGTELNTFDKILDLMIGIDMKEFSFYSNSVSVTDIAGAAIPATTLVVIRNANNSTFFVDYYGNPTCRKYTIYGTTGARTQTQIFNATS